MKISDIKITLRKMIIYLLIVILTFYALPILTNGIGATIAVIMYFMPIIILVLSIVYGVKQGFHLEYPIMVFLLYIPSIYLYYGGTAWTHALSYIFVSVLGNAVGMFLSSSRKQKK